MIEEEIEVDVDIKTRADKFHKFIRRSQHVPKATHYIKGCDLLEGEWGKVGSILLWKLVFGNGYIYRTLIYQIMVTYFLIWQNSREEKTLRLDIYSGQYNTGSNEKKKNSFINACWCRWRATSVKGYDRGNR